MRASREMRLNVFFEKYLMRRSCFLFVVDGIVKYRLDYIFHYVGLRMFASSNFETFTM